MASDEKRIAHEVHELLLSAQPHADDEDLAKAAELVAIERNSPKAADRAAVFVAIQRLQKSIARGGSAADLEQLLLDAIGAAERWVERSRREHSRG